MKFIPWVLVVGVALGGCSDEPGSEPTTAPHPTITSTPTPTPEPGSVPPEWLGTRVLPIDKSTGYAQVQDTPTELRNRHFTLPDTVDPLPGDGFASRIDRVPDDVLARSSWEAECPVRADQLRWVRLTFWGFDDARHTGELLVNADAAQAMVAAFERLYDAKYPIEEMRITPADELEAEPTGDGNNTSAFTCRPIAHGSTTWSEHSYGRAVDVNPFLNPYVKGDVVIPELASAYLDRGRTDPGVIHADDAVTRAFASVGWIWGGSWQHSKDYMHFSANGY